MLQLAAGGGLRVLPGFAAQVRPGGLHELHIRHPVLPGDLQAAHELLHVEGVEGPGAYGGVMAEDDALHALNDADADHEAGAHGVVGAPSGQGADLQKRRIPVQHRGYPLPNGHLAPRRQSRSGFRAAPLRCLVKQGLDFLQRLQHVPPVAQKGVVPSVELGLQHRHGCCLPPEVGLVGRVSYQMRRRFALSGWGTRTTHRPRSP